MPLFRLHHFHLPRLHVDLTYNLRIVYAIRFVRDLVNKLCLFFTPIFLFQLGTRLQVPENVMTVLRTVHIVELAPLQKGMIALSFYYLAFRLVGLSTTYCVPMIMRKLGLRGTLILVEILFFFHVGMMALATINPWWLVPVVIVDGVCLVLYIISSHALFAQHALKKHIGADVGAAHFLFQLAALSAPAIGGVMALWQGFTGLYLLGAAVALLGVIAASFLHGGKEDLLFLIDDAQRPTVKSLGVKTTTAIVGKYINDAALGLWPLYVFLIFGAVDKVGFLYSFSLFLALTLIFFFGFYIDHAKTRRPFLVSGGFISLLWFARLQTLTPWGITIVNTLTHLAENVHWLYYDALNLMRAKQGNGVQYFVGLERVVCLTAIIFWTCVPIFFLLPMGWQLVFITAGIGVLLTLNLSATLAPPLPERNV